MPQNILIFLCLPTNVRHYTSEIKFILLL